MTELEWLKQESGLTDDELKTYETILGDNKFKSMLKKVIDANASLTAAKAKAEGELEQFTTRYNSEFVPALRDVTQQAIDSDAKRAAAEAKLAKAKELGIVLGDEPVKEAPRAPGSPDPNLVTRDDFGQFQNRQANTLMALQDLNAEHFGLFNAPLGGTQELVNEVNRQHLLGNKGFTLKNAWEQKYNVAGQAHGSCGGRQGKGTRRPQGSVDQGRARACRREPPHAPRPAEPVRPLQVHGRGKECGEAVAVVPQFS